MSDTADHAAVSPLTAGDFSPMALRVLRTAVSTARARETEIFTETLYFSFFAVAFDSAASKDPEANLMALLLAALNAAEDGARRFDEQRKVYANSGPLPRTQEPAHFAPGEQLPRLSANTERVLTAAIGLASAGPGQIGARHLLAAMIAPNIGSAPYARRRFEELGIDLAAFRARFFGLVADEYPKDEMVQWQAYLGVRPAKDRPPQEQRPQPASKGRVFKVRDPDAPRPTKASVAPERRTQADAPTSERKPPEPDDPLIAQLLTRRLAASTMGSRDVDSALRLIDFPNQQDPSWGLGPPIERGDFLLIYFPKTLAQNRQLKDFGDQGYGLRFLVRAGADSEPAGPDDNFNQLVAIADPLELPNPLDPTDFTDPPLAEWGLARRSFQRAGREKEPLPPELAGALWAEILAANPEIRPTLESWVAEAPVAPHPADVSTHATSDLWTVDDKLGYAEYARAIYHFLDDPRTEPPLTISIQAPWGGGKTSLMRMIQRQLDPNGYELASGKAPEPPADTAVALIRGVWGVLAAYVGRLLGKARKLLRNSDAEEEPPPAAVRDSGEQPASTREVLAELDQLAAGKPGPVSLNLGDGRCASIWFNAWRYQSSDQIWAGLAEAIIRGITERMTPFDRERFLLRLHLSRVNPDRIRRDVYDAVFQRFVDILHKVGLLALGGILAVAGALAFWSPLLGGLSAPAMALVGSAVAYWKARLRTEDEPASINLSDYVDVPNYSEKLGFVHHVTEDLRKVFDLLPEIDREGEPHRAPLAIFIDDLDRCSPQKVAEVFEAINLFAAGEFRNCFIIIGMDTEVVAAALEEAHKEVIQRLPAYARRVPVGWRFMDKFVQLPFVIPPLDTQAVENYAHYLAAAEDREAREVQARVEEDERSTDLHRMIEFSLEQGTGDDDIVDQAKTFVVTGEVAEQSTAAKEGERLVRERIDAIKRQRFIDERARDLHADSDKIRDLLFAAKDNFLNNPRELKRLVNVYRFYYNLRLARIARKELVPTEAQLQNWLMLALAWPEVVRWLRRSYSEWETEATPTAEAFTAVNQRLTRMEALAVTAITEPAGTDGGEATVRDPACADWAAALRGEFGLPKGVSWLEDERLFGFIRKLAAGDDDQMLSSGAGRGFW